MSAYSKLRNPNIWKAMLSLKKKKAILVDANSQNARSLFKQEWGKKEKNELRFIYLFITLYVY